MVSNANFYENWDIETDVVVGGTGAGGLTSAIISHDSGLKVIVLEKSSAIGGGAAVSDGEVWIPRSHVAEREGIKDSDQNIDEYLEYLGSSYPVDKPVRKKWIEASRIAAKYLEEKAGLKWIIVKGLSDVFAGLIPSASSEGRYLEVEPINGEELGAWKNKVLRSPEVPYFVTNEEMFRFGGASTLKDWPQELLQGRIRNDVLCQGTGLIAYLLRAVAIDRKIQVYTGAPVKRLLSENGEVLGVETEINGKTTRIRSKSGVILNIGGYDWHPIYPFFFEQVPEWHSVMPPSIEGDFITLAQDAGASVIPFKIYSAMPGFHIPGEEWFGKDLYRQLAFEGGLPHSLVVNKGGKRFADESYFQDLGIKAALHDKTLGYINYPFYIIIDQQYREKYPFGSVEAGRPLPEGFAVQASSISDLAERLEMDPNILSETVERFNVFAREGVDRDFGRGSKAWANQYTGDLRHKPNPNLGAIEKPPFYGIRLNFVGIGHNGGYWIDTEGRVLDTRGKPIPGLYACGNCVAFTELGPTYQDGACLSRSIAFGYVAAEHLAKNRR